MRKENFVCRETGNSPMKSLIMISRKNIVANVGALHKRSRFANPDVHESHIYYDPATTTKNKITRVQSRHLSFSGLGFLRDSGVYIVNVHHRIRFIETEPDPVL